jgi:hypothetical protein
MYMSCSGLCGVKAPTGSAPAPVFHTSPGAAQAPVVWTRPGARQVSGTVDTTGVDSQNFSNTFKIERKTNWQG